MPTPAKPTRLKVLQGNPGKRPISKTEPKPAAVAKLGNAPRHLNRYGQREWRRMGTILQTMGLLTEIDLAAFEAYCATYGRWIQAELAVKEEGYTIITRAGNVIQNPNLGIANRALTEMRKWLIEFGLTPSSRSRISLQPEVKEDPFEAYLLRRTA